ncbi:hypothetical protein MAP00_001324 [Monascus purpureus]|nr:hypothetical protein MAP00_001324 [Monascus purpureus]
MNKNSGFITWSSFIIHFLPLCLRQQLANSILQILLGKFKQLIPHKPSNIPIILEILIENHTLDQQSDTTKIALLSLLLCLLHLRREINSLDRPLLARDLLESRENVILRNREGAHVDRLIRRLGCDRR